MVGLYPGTFDLCHAGHVLSFEEAKGACDRLIVALQHDPSVDRDDKKSPIMSIDERRIILAAIRHIDEVVEYGTEADLVGLVRRLKPDVYFAGADWKEKRFSAQDACEELGIRVRYLSRNHHYSSSELRARIARKGA